MKFSIERNTWARALSHVQSVVERRNTIPILGNILVQADKAGGRVSITASDMDLEVIESVPADVTSGGATTIPAHTLYDIIRKLPDGAQVELELTGQTVSVRSNRSNFKLGSLPVSDFPQLSRDALPHQFTVSSSELRALIDRARFAMSTEETRYYLNGIYLHAAKADGVSVLRAVATDGHRLARIEMPLPSGADDMPGIIVPRKTVVELRKLLEEGDQNVLIELSNAKLRFTLGAIQVTSKLIDGTYPDYDRVIPAANENTLEVDAQMLISAVDRVSTVTANEKTRSIKMAINKNNIVLTANSSDSGAVEELEARYDGPPMEIGFNSRYLHEIAGQIEGEGCRMKLADPAQPAIIQDSSDVSALYVLMPMRV